MTTANRPFGVSFLAGAAFLASAALTIGLALSLLSVVGEIHHPDLSAIFVLGLAEFCGLALAWIFAATGRDLWTLRPRGRSLALVLLCILGLAGVSTCLGDLSGLLFWLGPSICALAIAGVVYLFLPRIRHAFAGQAIRPTPAPPRPTRVIAVTSVASAACIIAAASVRWWSFIDWFQGLLMLSLVWLPYLFIPFRLRSQKIKSGLTLAIAMGSALFLPGIAVLRYAHEWEESAWIQGLLLLGLGLQPVLVATAARANQSLPHEPGDQRKAAFSYGYGVLLFASFLLLAIYGNFPSPITYDEARAMESMRGVHMAASHYAAAHQGFFPGTVTSTLSDENPDCDNDRPRMYNHDQSDGYILVYEAVSATKPVAGCRVAASYVATARPVRYGKTGRRSFFVDQTRIIRWTAENRSATAADPEIPAGSLPPL
jgi:hypothetical protein